MYVDDDGYYQVPCDILEKFQKDLNSLRSIVEYIPVSVYNLIKYIFLRDFFVLYRMVNREFICMKLCVV